MELLLSYIEFNQFQRFLLHQLDDYVLTDNEQIQLIKTTYFPSSVPLSSVIEEVIEVDSNINNEQNVNLYRAKVRAHNLYKKYVENGCEFEINISSMERKPLLNILGDIRLLIGNNNINLIDLILLFDSVKREMSILLKYSLSRFKVQSQYDAVCKLFANDISRSSFDDGIEIITSK